MPVLTAGAPAPAPATQEEEEQDAHCVLCGTETAERVLFVFTRNYPLCTDVAACVARAIGRDTPAETPPTADAAEPATDCGE